MSDAAELGPGDVVEAVRDMPPRPGIRSAAVSKGQRATVERIATMLGRCAGATGDCPGGWRATGLVLRELPLPASWAWCPCGWRKVGGGQADTVKRFESALRRPRIRVRELEDA